MKDTIKTIANNKKAYHEYFILEEYEAGIELFGTEVKSLRLGQCSIKESWINIHEGEVFVNGMHVNTYEKGNIFNNDPLRVRKLLLHRSEIRKLNSKLQEKGLTLIPLSVYFRGSLVKVRVGLCKGKKLYDKSEALAKKDQKRDVERAMKERY
ncbi:MAG: SsrA-binding protein SmpB [Lachnospiraceae bacterium]|nr:SsrA-binding protein SmpB [Candidatus Darwinimomas equi]